MKCTLCDYPVDDSDSLWGVDFPGCGPVHHQCGLYDEWLYFHRSEGGVS